MKIIIAGAGIGGLTAALCLQRAGFQVVLLERDAELAEVGAGLQCGANVIRVIAYLGLKEEIESLSVQPLRADFRDGYTGGLLYSMEFGEEYLARQGQPYLHIHRADLQTMLYNKVKANEQIELKFNSEVVVYNEGHQNIIVKLLDGTDLVGDLLIAADGINSNIRKQLLGGKKPVFTGNVAWRAVIKRDRLPKDWMQTITSNFVGAKKHVVLYYLRRHELVNMVAVVEDSSWASDSWVQQAPWEELNQAFADWHPTVRAAINAAKNESCYKWGLFDHKPLPNWSSKRVTLLGDAAHSTLPFMASGAAMAIEDARILQRSLEGCSTIESGLQVYQRNRMRRTAGIQRDSARLGKLYHINQKLLRVAAFKAIHYLGRSKQDRLASYDANTIALTE